jgi:hypothetical protein
MKMKKGIVLIFVLLIALSNCVFLSAITGSMGNARMVLYPEVNGWTNTVIDKTILVKNVNDMPINITLVADDDAKDFLEVIDKTFILEAGEEKKAQFQVKVKKEGTYEGRINVFFKDADPGSKEAGVVLSLTITIIAKKDVIYDEGADEGDIVNDNSEDIDDSSDSGETDKVNEKRNLFNGNSFLFWNALILAVILIVLLYLGGKKRSSTKHKKRRK